MSTELKRIGIVGAGQMGSAIARNLIGAGFDLVGFDIDRERLEHFCAQGGSAATSAAEVAANANVVITSLPSVAAYESAIMSSRGINSVSRDGLVVVETSTLPLAVKERSRNALREKGTTLLDCPLSGTADQAVNKDVIVFASGERAAFEATTAVFDAFARAHHYVGDFGAGTKMKFIANLLVGVHNVAASEAFVLSRKAGLDPEQVYEVINDSAGTSRMWEVRVPKMIAGDYNSGVATSVFLKDVLAIMEFARELDCPIPLFAASAQFYAAIAEMGYANQDTASVYELLATQAGVATS